MTDYANSLRVRARNLYPGRDDLLEAVANELDRLEEENARLREQAENDRKARLAETLAPDQLRTRKER